MAIVFSCGSCGRELRVKDALAGKQIYCPDCKSILKVPAEAPPEEPADALPVAAAEPEDRDAYSTRAEEPPPKKARRPKFRDDEDDWDEDESPRKKARPSASGGSIAALFGGIALLLGFAVFVVIGLVTGVWFIKILAICLIAGIVSFFRGLFGMAS